MLQALLFWSLAFHPLVDWLVCWQRTGRRRPRDESENADARLNVSLVFYRRDTCRRDDGPYPCPCPFRPHMRPRMGLLGTAPRWRRRLR